MSAPLRIKIRDAIANGVDAERLPGLEATVDRVLVAIVKDDSEATDPRELGGAIAGPGGPYGVGDVVIDTHNAVILEACEVAVVGGVRDGVLDPKPIVALVLRGRVNKTDDRVQALYLLNEDGAAGIVTQLIGLQARAGWGDEFLARVRERMAEMPT